MPIEPHTFSFCSHKADDPGCQWMLGDSEIPVLDHEVAAVELQLQALLKDFES